MSTTYTNMRSGKVKEILNEGIRDSLTAQQLVSTDASLAKQHSERALKWFRQALTLHPESSMVQGSLGHQLYFHATEFSDASFEEAYQYFHSAIESDPDNVAFICEAGLCRANIGDLPEASIYFNRALLINDSKETKNFIVGELAFIGQRAFEYGESLQKKGNQEEAESYKSFSIGALILAFQIDDDSEFLAHKISQYAKSIGDDVTAAEYDKILQSF